MKLLRRGTALILSLALLLSLVAVVATPSWSNTTSLGLLSRYYETGKTNTDAQAAAMISTVAGDPGGKSYGAYMFASKAGTVESFVNWCRTAATNTAIYDIGDRLYRAYYSNGAGCGPLFDQAWLEVAKDYGSAFFTAQESFSKSQIYDKAISLITSSSSGYYFDIDNYSVALKNVIWSRAVHHGPSGAASIVTDAFASLGGFANQAERDIIMAIYAQSGKVVDDHNGAEKMSGSLADKYNVDGKVLRYWYGSSSGVQLAVYRRLNVNEPADALAMLQENAFLLAPLPEGNYTIALKKDASTLALGVTGSAVKVINTAGENAGTPAEFTLRYLSGLGAYTVNTVVDNATLRLTGGTAGTGGFGEVTLTTPSTSDSQLWYIDSNGSLKNKATGTYLSVKNDTLVMVGTAGTDVTQPVTVIAAAETTNVKTVTGQKTVETTVEGQTTTKTEPAGPTVKYIADEFATFKADEALVLTSTTGEDGTTTYTLGALPTLTPAEGYTFLGWFTADGTEAVTNATAVPAEGLTLYAKYTKTVSSKIEPSYWNLSPVVKDAADFTLNQLIYPDSNTELHEKDSGFPVRGMISCSGKITNVNLQIVGSSISVNAYPNASFYDLSNLDSSVSYSSLKQGNYTYKLTATVGGTVYTLKESSFTVGAQKTPDVTTPSIPSSDSFTVTFDAGSNGTSAYSSKTYSLDSIVYGELPSVKVKNSSVEFVGWYTSDGVQILPGSPIVAENITLYAKYTNEYRYTFLKSNAVAYRTGTAAAGTVFTAPDSGPIKSPDSNYTYTFSHWVDSANNKYYSGQAIVMGEGDMTFQPVYTQKAYTSTPSGGGGGGSSGGGGGSSSGGGGGDSSTTTPSGPVWTVSPGATVSDVDGTVYSGGSVVSSGRLATGMVVKSGSNEYTISVKGDPSGDGKISVTDVVKLQSHLLNKSNLSGAYLEAADFNGDGKVTITDLVKAACVVAGKEKIG